MKICNICYKPFKENHFNQKCCSPKCRWRAVKKAKIKYKLSHKGKISNNKWIKSERRKHNEYNYRQKPKAKKLAVLRAKNYAKNHPEKIKLWANKEKERKRWLKKEYKIKNKISTKKYRKTEKGKQARRNANAIRKMREKTGKITMNEWIEKLNEYNNCCAICKSKNNLEQDHIIPLSKGGKHEINNIQPLCRHCNAKKSDKL